MKTELAEELLANLMDWDREAFQEKVRQLEALATYKFDEYANFEPGVKFFESLAAWLDQFEEPHDRAVALDFVLERLVFISDAEMTHLIELVYPDHIEMVLRARAARETGISPFAVAELARSAQFRGLRRRSLILGASDGAQLGRLRRSAAVLSHEQFLPSADLSASTLERMRDKLATALEKLGIGAPATFSQIFLVDDFAGSGQTLLREENGAIDGKLKRLHDAIANHSATGVLAEDLEVTLILYVATEQALGHLRATLPKSPFPDWTVEAAQILPDWIRVDRADTAMTSLAERYYDPALDDDIKGRVPLGYSDCALPVILSHNTPNNSIAILWGDTTAEPGSKARLALFPRFERHHRDRP